jgi:integrase/recombinase XerD
VLRTARADADFSPNFQKRLWVSLSLHSTGDKKMRQQLRVDWSREIKMSDLKPALGRYQSYLSKLGFSDQTIESYVFRAGKYLEFVKTDQPTTEDHSRFRDYLQEKKLARNTLNNYGSAAKRYHEMIGIPVNFHFLKPNDTIPYFFNEDDIAKIFGVCHNAKHYAMLMTMFYEALRASELCGLNDEDIDFEAMTIRVRGKWGREDLIPMNPEVACALQDYLKKRPSIKVNGEHPVFITDYFRRWNRMDAHRMFRDYKEKAGIVKPGGLHVFGRHSPASIMVKNGCDILTIKEIMRHRDIKTTSRYLHIGDQTKREKYEQFLRL